jgi:hypothetical protein
MSNLKIGDKIIDDETRITATVKSKRNHKTKEYDILLQDGKHIPTLIRQKSLPKTEKEQDAVAKKWEQSLKKSGLKSKKCNKGVHFAVHGPKHTFKVTTQKSKKRQPKTKVFIHPTSGRKFTITDVPKSRKKKGGRKRRKSRKSRRRGTRKKKRGRRTKKKRRRRRRKTRK